MILSRSLLLGVLLALIPTFTSAGGPAPLSSGSPFSCAHRIPYEVQLIQSGGPFGGSSPRQVPHLTYNYLNTGAAMPHLILSVDSRGSFTPGMVTARVNTGQRRYSPSIRLIGQTGSVYVWDFGSFPAGAEELIRIEIHLKHSCCYAARLQTFANVNQYGAPDPQSAVANGASGSSGESGSFTFTSLPHRH